MNESLFMLLTCLGVVGVALILFGVIRLPTLLRAWRLRQWAKRHGMRFRFFYNRLAAARTAKLLNLRNNSHCHVWASAKGRLEDAEIWIWEVQTPANPRAWRFRLAARPRRMTVVALATSIKSGRIAVHPKARQQVLDARPTGRVLSMEWIEFNRRFICRADDHRQAFALLTPRLLEQVAERDDWAFDVMDGWWVAWTGRLLTLEQCEQAVGWLKQMEQTLPGYLQESAESEQADTEWVRIEAEPWNR